jgi:hypothetical protein
MFVVDHDVLVLTIDSSLDIQDFTLLVDDEWSLVSEELPPSRVDSTSSSEVA